MIEETEKNHTGDNEHDQHQDHEMIGVDAAESLQLPIQQPHKQQQGDDDDDDDDARNVIHIPNLLVSEFLDLWSNPTIRAMDNSTNNKNHPISEPTIRDVGTVTTSSNEALALLGLVLIHGSWTQSIQTTCIPRQEQQQKQEEQRQQEQQPSTPTDSATMSMSSSQLSNWLCQATKGIQCHLITASLMICEQTDPEAYHLFMEQPLKNRTTVLPSELPALAVVSQWNTHVGATADDDDDDDHGGRVGSTSKSRTRTSIRYLNDLASSKLLWQFLLFQQEPKLPELIPGVDSLARQQVRRRWTETDDAITKLVRWAVYELEDELELPTTMITQKHDEDGDDHDPCIRIFVAGDRSSVGKSSTCLGLLGTLMYQLGFEPHQLAYIKPATQSEALHQPIQVFCEHVGIRCVPIGPLVYYRGFTRAFLAGETESTQQLLQHCMDAVDRVARDKRVVIVDGVGFPAVGSICGTDNATMAHVCGYPISINSSSCTSSSSSFPQRRPMGALLVGGSGVGAAVDGYNLNAAFFENAQVPVLGAIFNKLSLTGYYALEHCQKQVSMYFEQRQEQQQLLQQQSDLTPIDRPQPRPFGFVPVFPKLAEQEPDGRTIRIQTVREFIAVFQSHVDVAGILQAAAAYRQPLHASATTTTMGKEPVLAQSLLAKEQQQQQQASWIPKGRTPSTGPPTRTNQQQQQQNRQEIERKAIYAGAAPSA